MTRNGNGDVEYEPIPEIGITPAPDTVVHTETLDNARWCITLRQAVMAHQDSAIPETLRVFISYTRESEVHDQRVAELARRIISDLGFDCDIDQFHANQNWPQWMEERLEWADRVLVVATPTYLRRWSGKEVTGVGLGAKWESLLTRQVLYDLEGKTNKFVPVIFSPEHVRYIPTPLKGYTRVVMSPGGDLHALRLRLLDIAPIQKPPLPAVAPLSKLDDQYFPNFKVTLARKAEARTDDCERYDRSPLGVSSEPEELISNLFPILYPTTIHTVRTPKRTGFREFSKSVEQYWRGAGRNSPALRDYVVDGHTVYRFKPFSEEPWVTMIKHGKLFPSRSLNANVWAQSAAFSETGNFIKLLNGSLTELCRTHDMDYSADLRCHLFQHGGARYRVLKVKSVTNYGTRELCKAIRDKNSQDPNAILHYQHQAFRHQFKRFGGGWFLIITPFWAFTSDGKTTKSRFQKSWSSKARKPERNRTVLGHLLLWKSVLCREVDMFRQSSGFQVMPPLSLEVTPSIEDQEWVVLSKGEERASLEPANDELQRDHEA